MNKICAVYRITNTITKDFYIGSSKNVKKRWMEHKRQSTWSQNPNKQLYQDMQKLGVDKFVFEIIEEVEVDKLKETEQKFIELLKPTYNNYNAKGVDIERKKETQKEYRKEYQKSEKYKEYQKEYRNVHKEEAKEYRKEYQKSEKGKESQKKATKKYYSQLCLYNGETLTLKALSTRFWRKGIPHPTAEAKKYLLQ